jgi:predicted membrane metal-binding protein
MVRPTEMVPDVLSDVQSAVETDGMFHELSLISVVLKAEALSQEVQIQLDNGTLLLRLQRQLGAQHKEMWPYELVLETPPKKMNFDDFDHDSWQQAETETFTKAQVATVADKLFAYDFIESYFSSNEAIEKVRLAAIEQLNGKKSKGF